MPSLSSTALSRCYDTLQSLELWRGTVRHITVGTLFLTAPDAYDTRRETLGELGAFVLTSTNVYVVALSFVEDVDEHEPSPTVDVIVDDLHESIVGVVVWGPPAASPRSRRGKEPDVVEVQLLLHVSVVLRYTPLEAAVLPQGSPCGRSMVHDIVEASPLVAVSQRTCPGGGGVVTEEDVGVLGGSDLRALLGSEAEHRRGIERDTAVALADAVSAAYRSATVMLATFVRVTTENGTSNTSASVFHRESHSVAVPAASIAAERLVVDVEQKARVLLGSFVSHARDAEAELRRFVHAEELVGQLNGVTQRLEEALAKSHALETQLSESSASNVALQRRVRSLQGQLRAVVDKARHREQEMERSLCEMPRALSSESAHMSDSLSKMRFSFFDAP